jgi:hypothetical protein
MKRVQFNVRIREDVAELLRDEAERRQIGPGHLLEELATSYRSATRPGLWLELPSELERGLRAASAAHGLPVDELMGRLLGSAVRDLLDELTGGIKTADPLRSAAATSGAQARRLGDGSESTSERRSRARRVTLTDDERARLDQLPEGLPRTGEALRGWREARQLTRGELGTRCGVSSVAVGLWENKGELPAPILLKLDGGIGEAP